MTEWIGWFATALFASSYAAKTSPVLRRVQALAACVWIVYGTALGATPVVAANAIVAVAALTSARRIGAQPDGHRETRVPAPAVGALPAPARVGAFIPFAGVVNWRSRRNEAVGEPPL